MCALHEVIHRGCEPLLKDLQDIAKVIEGPQWDDSDEQNKNDESNSKNQCHEPVNHAVENTPYGENACREIEY